MRALITVQYLIDQIMLLNNNNVSDHNPIHPPHHHANDSSVSDLEEPAEVDEILGYTSRRTQEPQPQQLYSQQASTHNGWESSASTSDDQQSSAHFADVDSHGDTISTDDDTADEDDDNAEKDEFEAEAEENASDKDLSQSEEADIGIDADADMGDGGGVADIEEDNDVNISNSDSSNAQEVPHNVPKAMAIVDISEIVSADGNDSGNASSDQQQDGDEFLEDSEGSSEQHAENKSENNTGKMLNISEIDTSADNITQSKDGWNHFSEVEAAEDTSLIETGTMYNISEMDTTADTGMQQQSNVTTKNDATNVSEVVADVSLGDSAVAQNISEIDTEISGEKSFSKESATAKDNNEVPSQLETLYADSSEMEDAVHQESQSSTVDISEITYEHDNHEYLKQQQQNADAQVVSDLVEVEEEAGDMQITDDYATKNNNVDLVQSPHPSNARKMLQNEDTSETQDREVQQICTENVEQNLSLKSKDDSGKFDSSSDSVQAVQPEHLSALDNYIGQIDSAVKPLERKQDSTQKPDTSPPESLLPVCKGATLKPQSNAANECNKANDDVIFAEIDNNDKSSEIGEVLLKQEEQEFLSDSEDFDDYVIEDSGEPNNFADGEEEIISSDSEESSDAGMSIPPPPPLPAETEEAVDSVEEVIDDNSRSEVEHEELISESGSEVEEEVIEHAVEESSDSGYEQVVESWQRVVDEEPVDLEAAVTALIAVIYKDEEVDIEKVLKRTPLQDLYKYLKRQYWYRIHTDQEEAAEAAMAIGQESPMEVVTVDDILRGRLEDLIANAQETSRCLSENSSKERQQEFAQERERDLNDLISKIQMNSRALRESKSKKGSISPEASSRLEYASKPISDARAESSKDLSAENGEHWIEQKHDGAAPTIGNTGALPLLVEGMATGNASSDLLDEGKPRVQNIGEMGKKSVASEASENKPLESTQSVPTSSGEFDHREVIEDPNMPSGVGENKSSSQNATTVREPQIIHGTEHQKAVREMDQAVQPVENESFLREVVAKDSVEDENVRNDNMENTPTNRECFKCTTEMPESQADISKTTVCQESMDLDEEAAKEQTISDQKEFSDVLQRFESDKFTGNLVSGTLKSTHQENSDIQAEKAEAAIQTASKGQCLERGETCAAGDTDVAVITATMENGGNDGIDECYNSSQESDKKQQEIQEKSMEIEAEETVEAADDETFETAIEEVKPHGESVLEEKLDRTQEYGEDESSTSKDLVKVGAPSGLKVTRNENKKAEADQRLQNTSLESEETERLKYFPLTRNVFKSEKSAIKDTTTHPDPQQKVESQDSHIVAVEVAEEEHTKNPNALMFEEDDKRIEPRDAACESKEKDKIKGVESAEAHILIDEKYQPDRKDSDVNLVVKDDESERTSSSIPEFIAIVEVPASIACQGATNEGQECPIVTQVGSGVDPAERSDRALATKTIKKEDVDQKRRETQAPESPSGAFHGRKQLHAKNESVPPEKLLNINATDEEPGNGTLFESKILLTPNKDHVEQRTELGTVDGDALGVGHTSNTAYQMDTEVKDYFYFKALSASPDALTTEESPTATRYDYQVQPLHTLQGVDDIDIRQQVRTEDYEQYFRMAAKWIGERSEVQGIHDSSEKMGHKLAEPEKETTQISIALPATVNEAGQQSDLDDNLSRNGDDNSHEENADEEKERENGDDDDDDTDENNGNRPCKRHALNEQLQADFIKRMSTLCQQGDKRLPNILNQLFLENDTDVARALVRLSRMLIKEEKDDRTTVTMYRVSGHLVVINAMRKFQGNVEVQAEGCRVISSLCHWKAHINYVGIGGIGNMCIGFAVAGALEGILEALELHPEHELLQRRALRALNNMMSSKHVVPLFYEVKALPAVLESMKRLPNNANIQEDGCRIMRFAGRYSAAKKTFKEVGAFDVLATVLKHFEPNSRSGRQAAKTLHVVFGK